MATYESNVDRVGEETMVTLMLKDDLHASQQTADQLSQELQVRTL